MPWTGSLGADCLLCGLLSIFGDGAAARSDCCHPPHGAEWKLLRGDSIRADSECCEDAGTPIHTSLAGLTQFLRSNESPRGLPALSRMPHRRPSRRIPTLHSTANVLGPPDAGAAPRLSVQHHRDQDARPYPTSWGIPALLSPFAPLLHPISSPPPRQTMPDHHGALLPIALAVRTPIGPELWRSYV